MKNSTVFLGHRRAVVSAAGVTGLGISAARRRALAPVAMTARSAAVAAVSTVDADGFAAAGSTSKAAVPAQRTAPGVRPRGTPV